MGTLVVNRFALVQLLEPLAPPRQPDRAKQRLACRAHHLAHCSVDREQGLDGRSLASRKVSEGQLLVGA